MSLRYQYLPGSTVAGVGGGGGSNIIGISLGPLGATWSNIIGISLGPLDQTILCRSHS